MSATPTPELIAKQLSRYAPLKPIINEVGLPPTLRVNPVAKRFPTLVRAIRETSVIRFAIWPTKRWMAPST